MCVCAKMELKGERTGVRMIKDQGNAMDGVLLVQYASQYRNDMRVSSQVSYRHEENSHLSAISDQGEEKKKRIRNALIFLE